MDENKAILLEAEAFASNYIIEQVSKSYAYHDIQHTRNVVASSLAIAEHYDLTQKELELLQLAAWFHDTGYDKGPTDHEARSAQYAKDFLAKYSYHPDDITIIRDCIMSTQMPQSPNSLLEQILCDADMNHLGKSIYWDRCGRLRQELAMTQSLNMSEQEWMNFEINFIKAHSYFTPVAEKFYGKQKLKHCRQLEKQNSRLNPSEVLTVDEMTKTNKKDKSKKKKKKKKEKKPSLGRGVETMYRTTYRTHVNLSSIADNKANIMLSINAIIVSITLSTLIPQLNDNPKLIIPTMMLLGVCLGSIIFATLSTRPKITEGIFTRQDIQEKKSNLLFFGNFYNMELKDFQWGMNEMINDSDFLYSTMTRDLYFLGVVLAKKYKFLRICYSIFMYGLIATVIVFAIVFLK